MLSLLLALLGLFGGFLLFLPLALAFGLHLLLLANEGIHEDELPEGFLGWLERFLQFQVPGEDFGLLDVIGCLAKEFAKVDTIDEGELAFVFIVDFRHVVLEPEGIRRYGDRASFPFLALLAHGIIGRANDLLGAVDEVSNGNLLLLAFHVAAIGLELFTLGRQDFYEVNLGARGLPLGFLVVGNHGMVGNDVSHGETHATKVQDVGKSLFLFHGSHKDVGGIFFATLGNYYFSLGDPIIVRGEEFDQQLTVGRDFHILCRLGNLNHGRLVGNDGKGKFLKLDSISLRGVGIAERNPALPVLSQNARMLKVTFLVARQQPAGVSLPQDDCIYLGRLGRNAKGKADQTAFGNTLMPKTNSIEGFHADV